ncbi:uncharacterized protein LOC143237477 isoform X2 [Tachypleus tridentatus]|uniref:uncharacterized protein LOC143237477 isoform X2 n=1 Tax=Tachypleus tridentatus TaxID=6853 RepID=UPI003FD49F84
MFQELHTLSEDDLECLDTILSATNIDDALTSSTSTLPIRESKKRTRPPWVQPGYVSKQCGRQPDSLGKTSQSFGNNSWNSGCSCLSNQDLSNSQNQQNCLRVMDVTLIRNLSDRNGNNLWHVCCNQNHLHCLQWLCNQDSNEALMDENNNGFTPIILAIRHGNVEIVQWLLENTTCGNLLETSVRDRSLLHYTAKYGQEQLVHWLSENVQTSINYCDSKGDTPLHLAAKYGHIGCAKALILHGADISAKNELGLNPHDLAIYSERPSCTDYLTVMEACLSLSAKHLFLEEDMEHLLSVNMELKSLVKKLLALSKHLFKQQNEMLETFKVIHSDLGTAGTSLSKDGTGEKVKIIRNSLNETKTSGEEAKLQRIENKWRRLRMNPNKGTEDRRLPLDLLKSHFAQILAKSSSPVLGKTSRISSSSSESTLSLDSFSDEDEKEVQPEKELHNLQNLYLSMPSASWCCSTNLPTADNLHSLCGTLNIDSKSINHADRELSKICSHYESKFGKKTKDLKKSLHLLSLQPLLK